MRRNCIAKGEAAAFVAVDKNVSLALHAAIIRIDFGSDTLIETYPMYLQAIVATPSRRIG